MGIVIGKVGALIGITAGILLLVPYPFTFNPFFALFALPASVLGLIGCHKAEKGNKIGIIIMFLSALLLILPAFFLTVCLIMLLIVLGMIFFVYINPFRN
ncbi:MAG: hypothetical protein Q8P87_00825 [bacterium]|nr:hypothetical protein [bacterium]